MQQQPQGPLRKKRRRLRWTSNTRRRSKGRAAASLEDSLGVALFQSLLLLRATECKHSCHQLQTPPPPKNADPASAATGAVGSELSLCRQGKRGKRRKAAVAKETLSAAVHFPLKTKQFKPRTAKRSDYGVWASTHRIEKRQQDSLSFPQRATQTPSFRRLTHDTLTPYLLWIRCHRRRWPPRRQLSRPARFRSKQIRQLGPPQEASPEDAFYHPYTTSETCAFLTFVIDNGPAA